MNYCQMQKVSYNFSVLCLSRGLVLPDGYSLIIDFTKGSAELPRVTEISVSGQRAQVEVLHTSVTI